MAAILICRRCGSCAAAASDPKYGSGNGNKNEDLGNGQSVEERMMFVYPCLCRIPETWWRKRGAAGPAQTRRDAEKGFSRKAAYHPGCLGECRKHGYGKSLSLRQTEGRLQGQRGDGYCQQQSQSRFHGIFSPFLFQWLPSTCGRSMYVDPSCPPVQKNRIFPFWLFQEMRGLFF